MINALVIGGGFAGCTAALLLSEKGWRVTLVEKEGFLGGGCKTHFYGGHPYTFGPRHFLTKDEELYDFLNQYVPLRRIGEHEFLTYVERDGRFYNYPIHYDDINIMPDREKIFQELNHRSGIESVQNLEEYWIASVGVSLYSKFVENYSKKMWGIESNTEIDDFSWSPKGITLKTGSRAAWTEAISAFPLSPNGYDDYFRIATQNTEVHLNTTIDVYDVENHRVKTDGEWHSYDIIVSTISPEILLNHAFGPLRWIGRELFKIVLPVEECFPPNVYFLYYANEEPFTRIVEYKRFYRYKAPTTLIGIEIPSFKNKLYPYPVRKDQEQAKRYFDTLPERVFSIGRAGAYEYRIEISGAIRQARELVSKL